MYPTPSKRSKKAPERHDISVKAQDLTARWAAAPSILGAPGLPCVCPAGPAQAPANPGPLGWGPHVSL